MLEKVSKTMRDAIIAVAGPRTEFDTRQSWFARAAKRAGLSFRQVKSLYYGETTSDLVKRRIRDAAIEAGRAEALQLANQFETIAGAMNAADENFFGPDAAALLDVARTLRRMDRTGA